MCCCICQLFQPYFQFEFIESRTKLGLVASPSIWEQCCPPEFQITGMGIAKNCRGLPLAVSVIGGLLCRSKRTVDYWMHVEQNINSAVTGTEDQIMEILSLSYNDLPHHLRSCFLYMGAYPEDHQMHIPKLVKLWVAEGFVKPVRSKKLEAEAEKYLEELIDRNMVLVLERTFTGKIKACGLRDLMRDFCVRKAQEEKFLQVMDRHVEFSPECIYNQRRISIFSDIYNRFPEINVSPVRSLLQFHYRITPTRNIFIHFPLLRVLNASNLAMAEFPVEVVELVNLRYLALFPIVDELPGSISKLLNLQTLIIRCHNTVNLPIEIWMMPQLRHILINSCFLPYPSSAQIREKNVLLENLQTLDCVKNFRFTEEVLRMMPNLKKLAIRYDANTELSSCCIDNIFIHLHQLEVLKCFFGYQYDPMPKNFALAARLKNLTLSQCSLSWKNMADVGSLPNLEGLKLKSVVFEYSPWEPREGEFLKLKFLLLWETNLEHWKADETHFPNLQRLYLGECTELVEVPSGIGEILTLQEIIYFNCPSAVISLESIQKEQEDLENYSLRITCDSQNKLH